jgi:hypothetical protein
LIPGFGLLRGPGAIVRRGSAGFIDAAAEPSMRVLQAILQPFDFGAQGLDLFDQATDQRKSFHVQQHGGIGIDAVPAQFYQPVFLCLADALKLPLQLNFQIVH